MEVNPPPFISPDAKMVLETRMFCGVSVPVFVTVGNPEKISGWTENPRTQLIIKRWRKKEHFAPEVKPDDDTLLALMLDDDDMRRGSSDREFNIIKLGEDIKRNGIRVPLIVTWDGCLIEGNRRKMASKWAQSLKGGATEQQRLNIENSPILVLPESTGQNEIDAIVREMNYAPDLKNCWGDVITNGYVYERYIEYYNADPTQDEKDVRRRVAEDFPMFSITEIAYRVRTWDLTQQFRADYGGDLSEEELDRLIDRRYQQFRQAHDTYRNKECYKQPAFKDLLFEGIRHGLFPSFASVRKLGDIYDSSKAQKIFLEGIGLSEEQKDRNFTIAVAEANRHLATKRLPIDGQIRECIQFLDTLTSPQLAAVSKELVDELSASLRRVIAQATATPTPENGTEEGV